MKIPAIPSTSIPREYLKFSTTVTKAVNVILASQVNNDRVYYGLSSLLYRAVLIKSILPFHG